MGSARIVGILLIAAGALGAAWVPARTSIDAQAVALPAQAELRKEKARDGIAVAGPGVAGIRRGEGGVPNTRLHHRRLAAGRSVR